MDCTSLVLNGSNTTGSPNKLGPSLSLGIALIITLVIGIFIVFLAHGFNLIRKHVYEDKVRIEKLTNVMSRKCYSS